MLDPFHAIFDVVSATVCYLIAAAMAVGGGYLIFGIDPASRLGKPLRYLGIVLIVGGGDVALATYAYHHGISTGGARIEAEWKKKDYETKLAALQRDNDALKAVQELKDQQAKEIQQQRDEANAQMSDYRTLVSRLSDAARKCRLATPDDDRSVCAIVGNRAPGCKPARLSPDRG